MRTISPAVLDGTTFFSDPTFWSTFSPARFGPAVWPFFVALVFTAIAVLPARWLAFRLGAVAAPGERRIHSRPTARLGGLAMYLGFGLSAALFSTNPSTLGLLLSAAVVTTLMVLDDLNGVRALSKLAFQIAASLLAIVVFGIYIHSVNLPGGHVVNLAVAVSIPLTLLWFVGLQNTVNLIDGVDGLAAGVVAIVAATLLLAAINREQMDIVILSGALIGACVGFLFFNWHPARVFMGDTGSNFLGFTLAALSVLSVAKLTWITAFPVLLRILEDRGYSARPVGRIAVACAALGDATAWAMLGVIVAAVQSLKGEPGEELQVWGSGNLLQTLLKHDLVDRLRLMTFPLVLGSGRRLFNDGVLPATMRPVELTVTDLGIVIGTYEPAGPVRYGEM